MQNSHVGLACQLHGRITKSSKSHVYRPEKRHGRKPRSSKSHVDRPEKIHGRKSKTPKSHVCRPEKIHGRKPKSWKSHVDKQKNTWDKGQNSKVPCKLPILDKTNYTYITYAVDFLTILLIYENNLYLY